MSVRKDRPITTRVADANSAKGNETVSLKTTIPAKLAKEMNIRAGDIIVWSKNNKSLQFRRVEF